MDHHNQQKQLKLAIEKSRAPRLVIGEARRYIGAKYYIEPIPFKTMILLLSNDGVNQIWKKFEKAIKYIVIAKNTKRTSEDEYDMFQMFIFDILVRCSDVWDKTKFSDFENIKIKDINKKRIGSAHLKAVIKAVQKLDFLLFSQKYSFMLNVLSKHGDLRNLNWTFQKLVKVCENYTFKMNDGLIVFKEALNFKNHNALRARTDFFVRHTFCLIQNSFGEKCFYGMIAYLVNNIFSDFINENNLNDYDETSVRKIVKDLRK